MLLFVPLAHAFCGTFVGDTDTALINHSSQAILTRQGTRTTLTLATQYEGPLDDFALLLPVPEVITKEDVRTVDESLIARVDQYSTPRAVEYTCEDLYKPVENTNLGVWTFGMGCASADYSVTEGFSTPGEDAASSVQVEAAFSIAAYDIVVLSAEESDDLFGWLDRNGYRLPAGGEDILQEYIDAGSYFLAAKVSLDRESDDASWLPPLQFSYESEVFSLPIRIGTISSDGEQEVVIYALTEYEEVGISNYPQLTVEDECMFSGELSEHYAAAVDEATAGGPGWIVEHSWDLGQVCDPCTSPDPFSAEEVGLLGFEGADTGHYGSFLGHLTRLRMRYTAEEATQDLVLYESGMAAQEQTRFITYAPEFESLFPVCGEGFVDDPGACPDTFACAVAPQPLDVRRWLLGVGALGLSIVWLRRSR